MPRLSSPILDSLRNQRPHPMFQAGGKFAPTTATRPVEVPRYSLTKYIELVKQIPDGKYALVRSNGELDFLEVVTEGNRNWIRRLIGAPGDFRRERLSYEHMFHAARHILEDLPQCAQRFGRHFTVCGRCESPLTRPESRAMGLGPTCRKAYGL